MNQPAQLTVILFSMQGLLIFVPFLIILSVMFSFAFGWWKGILSAVGLLAASFLIVIYVTWVCDRFPI